MNIQRLANPSPSTQKPFRTVLQKWFSSRSLSSDHHASLYHDDESLYVPLHDEDDNRYFNSSDMNLFYTDDEKKQARFRPSRDGM